MQKDIESLTKDMGEALLNIIQATSIRIGNALTPLNPITMPGFAVVLEDYTEELKAHPEFDTEFYHVLRTDMESQGKIYHMQEQEDVEAFKHHIGETLERLRESENALKSQGGGGKLWEYKTCPYCGANLDPDEKCDCGGGRV